MQYLRNITINEILTFSLNLVWFSCFACSLSFFLVVDSSVLSKQDKTARHCTFTKKVPIYSDCKFCASKSNTAIFSIEVPELGRSESVYVRMNPWGGVTWKLEKPNFHQDRNNRCWHCIFWNWLFRSRKSLKKR